MSVQTTPGKPTNSPSLPNPAIEDDIYPVLATRHSSLVTRHTLRPLIPIALLTLLAFLLRRYHLGDESLWFDEADIVSRAQQPLSILLQGFTQAGENGPFYTLLLHWWLALLDAVPLLGQAVHAIFGAGFEAPPRALSAIFGTAAIPLMYLLARMAGGRPAGLAAATLLTFNPFHIWHSQDAKMYSLLVLMTLASTLLYVKAIERNTLPLWAGYVLATWVMLTTHSMAVLVLLAQLVATPALFRGRQKAEGRRQEAENGQDKSSLLNPEGDKSNIQNPRSKIVPWGWAMLLILGPLFPIAWLRLAALVTDTVDVGGWYAPAGLHDIFGTVSVSFAVNRAPQPWEAIGALAMLSLALLGAGLAAMFQRRRKTTDEGRSTRNNAIRTTHYSIRTKSEIRLLIVVLWLLPIAGLWLVTLRVPLFQARYLIMALPPYLTLVTLGILWLRRLHALAAAVPVLLIAATTGVTLAGVNYSATPQKEDWRGAMVYVQDHARLRDVIVVFPGYLRTAVDAYYNPGGPGRVPDIPINTVPSLRTKGLGQRELEEQLMSAVKCHERAWLVTSPPRQAQEDPGNRVQQWFQFNNWHTFDTQVFNGVTVYGIAFNEVLGCWYPPPDYPEAHTFENGLQFSGYIYELRADGTTQPDASYFPLTLYWHSEGKLNTDYIVNVKIKDAEGKVVKEEALGTLNGYWPTSQWPPGADVIDYRDIRLPGGIAPGAYTVSLQLYPKGQPNNPLKLKAGGDEIVFKEALQVVPWQP